MGMRRREQGEKGRNAAIEGGGQDEVRFGIQRDTETFSTHLSGVHSSSQISDPILVSCASRTPSPNDTFLCPVALRRISGR